MSTAHGCATFGFVPNISSAVLVNCVPHITVIWSACQHRYWKFYLYTHFGTLISIALSSHDRRQPCPLLVA